MKFSDLNLHSNLEMGLKEVGYLTCTPVQEQVLQRAFSGQDLYVQSQTGTGKTAAFLVVIYQRLLSEPMLHGKKALIMVPTRELAVQVEEEAKLLGKHLPFKTGSFYGGVGYTQQTALLKNNVQIMVGTPGRVLDLTQGRKMNLMEIAFLILDEADRMFDMGFYPDLRKLIRVVPPADRRQTMLFSATLNTWVKNLAWEYTKNPYEIAIEPETVTVDEVEQILYHVSSSDKMKLLLGILKREDPESVLIFCNTKRYAEIIAKRLNLNGLECEFIMGDLPQSKRLKIINDIKAGKLRILVATDVAARGLDIEDLALVVNYDLPNETENYVHRIGRTARAGKTGKAITLCSEQDVYELPGIERYIGRKILSENAGEELFAEDKGEGKHIHTEFYEERERSSGHRSGEGRRHSEGRQGHTRQSNDRQSDSRLGDNRHGRRERHSPRGRGRIKQNDRGSSRSQTVPQDITNGENLLGLSLDERMAYYKQKYDTSGSSRSSQKAPTGKETQYGEKRRGKKRKSKLRRGKSANSGIQIEDGPGSSSLAPEQSASKKSVLSRFVELFRKK